MSPRPAQNNNALLLCRGHILTEALRLRARRRPQAAWIAAMLAACEPLGVALGKCSIGENILMGNYSGALLIPAAAARLTSASASLSDNLLLRRLGETYNSASRKAFRHRRTCTGCNARSETGVAQKAQSKIAKLKVGLCNSKCPR